MEKDSDIQFVKEFLKEALEVLESSEDFESCKGRLITLLQTTLGFIKAGRSNQMGHFKLQELINRAIELVEYQLRVRNLTISFSIPEEEIFIKGKEQAFLKALLYLLMEIIKLHDLGKDFNTLYLGAEHEEDGIRLILKVSTSSRAIPALGYAKGLTEEAGGRLLFKHSGDEIVFIVLLPELEQQQQEARPLSVLVVDDDPLIRELFLDFFEMLGENCTVCESQKEALEIIKTSKPDLVLIDFHMPGLNGIEFTKMAMNHIDRRSLCLLTGERSSLIESFSIEQGIKVIKKPVTLSSIRDFIREFKHSKCLT